MGMSLTGPIESSPDLTQSPPIVDKGELEVGQPQVPIMDMSRNDNLGAILEQNAGMQRELVRLSNEVANMIQQHVTCEYEIAELRRPGSRMPSTHCLNSVH